jgi:multiple sugar transport system permease protein
MSKQKNSYQLARKRREAYISIGVTLLGLALLGLYLMPLAYGLVNSVKSKAQVAEPDSPIFPSEAQTFEYEGESYPLVVVPMPDGTSRQLALFQKGRSRSSFMDIENPTAPLIEWEGNWRELEDVRVSALHWENYPEAWDEIDFAQLLFNTMVYAVVTMLGTVVASSLVAYGFSRFDFPFKSLLFIVLISTIILPPAVTLVPTYAFFVNVLGWGGTWLPLMVPQMFGNAYNVFLLRQYFMTIPREMEEAAKIDGAGPVRTFLSVILPQAIPALTAVCLFHFFFAWNDFFGPLIYLAGNNKAIPISVGLTQFNGLYNAQTQLMMAAAIITMILPLVIFFFAQRVFIQGIVVTGVDK